MGYPALILQIVLLCLAIQQVSSSCERGSILRKSVCVSCETLPNTRSSRSIKQQEGECLCTTNFSWSKQEVGCFPQNVISRSLRIQIGCDVENGFIINSQGQCVSCQNIEDGCIQYKCQPGRIYNAETKTCICNSAISILSTDGICMLCANFQNALAETKNNSCTCSRGFQWNQNISNGLGSCHCSFTIIDNVCFDCSSLALFAEHDQWNCYCKNESKFLWNSSSLQGSCVCNDTLRIPSKLTNSCICNPFFSIAYQGGCLDCRKVRNSTKNVSISNSNACQCLPLYKWNESSLSCDHSSDIIQRVLFQADLSNCPIDMSFNASAGKCECFSLMVLMNSKCQCIPFSTKGQLGCECLPLMVYNSSQDSCVCSQNMIFIQPQGCKCLELMVLNNKTCVCKYPLVYKNGFCKCQDTAQIYNQNKSKCEYPCSASEVYVPIDRICMNCSSVIEGCITCINLNFSGIYRCELCDQNQYLTQDYICLNCSSKFQNCSRCNISSCTTCIDQKRYRVINGVCAHIYCPINNCMYCVLGWSQQSSNNITLCYECKGGFTLNNHNTSCIQQACSRGYILVDGICTCPAGSYQSVNSICELCPLNCSICSNKNCTQCNSGYYLSTWNNSCTKCKSYCIRCSAYSCSICDDGYSLINGQCKAIVGIESTQYNNTYIQCNVGCSVCSIMDNKMSCLQAKIGYMVNLLAILKCPDGCQTCKNDGVTCLTCFSRYTLSGNSCKMCTNSEALSCSPDDQNYATKCLSYQTATISFNQTGGLCNHCASNCSKCDVEGAGNCDDGYCELGYVRLVNTKNCTSCLKFCSHCDPQNLTNCLDCGPYRFKDDSGDCLICSIGCSSCSSFTVCQLCIKGYTLVNGTCKISVKYPCAFASIGQKCQLCYAGYRLSNNICVIDDECNIKRNCIFCPIKYFLNNSQCILCPSILGCNICNKQNPNLCEQCSKGYYIQNNSCAACPIGCNDCFSQTYCRQAADGFYLVQNNDLTNTGIFKKCDSPCKTCIFNPSYCLSCISLYVIRGTKCSSYLINTFKMTLASNNKEDSVFNDTDESSVQLQKIFMNINRIINSICKSLPQNLQNISQNCNKIIIIESITSGSVIVIFSIDLTTISNKQEVKVMIANSILAKGIDGCLVVNNQMSSSQSESSSTYIIIIVVANIVAILLFLILGIFLYRRYCNKHTPIEDDIASSMKNEAGSQISDQYHISSAINTE